MNGTTETSRSGLAVDVLLPPVPAGGPAALVWHGRGPSERLVMRRFAVALADRGVAVAVPDHRPFDPDGGRAVLFESVAWFEDRMGAAGVDPDRTAVVGWSYGARAALGLVLSRPGAPFRRAVGIAGTYAGAAPTSGTPPIELVGSGPDVELLLVHGTLDLVSRPAASADLHRAATGAGIPCDLVLVEADHSEVVAASHEPALGMSVPAVTLAPIARHVVEATASFLGREAPSGR